MISVVNNTTEEMHALKARLGVGLSMEDVDRDRRPSSEGLQRRRRSRMARRYGRTGRAAAEAAQNPRDGVEGPGSYGQDLVMQDLVVGSIFVIVCLRRPLCAYFMSYGATGSKYQPRAIRLRSRQTGLRTESRRHLPEGCKSYFRRPL